MLNSMIFRAQVQRAVWGLVLCLLIVSPCWAGDTHSTTERLEQMAQYLAVLGTVITLLGGAVTVVLKLAESISLRSRRKGELDRVDSLGQLMAKIKNDAALSVATRDRSRLKSRKRLKGLRPTA